MLSNVPRYTEPLLLVAIDVCWRQHAANTHREHPVHALSVHDSINEHT